MGLSSERFWQILSGSIRIQIASHAAGPEAQIAHEWELERVGLVRILLRRPTFLRILQ